MIYEFEGRTEQEAIEKAVKQLGIDQNRFEVEILSREKQGIIFKRNVVRIRVCLDELVEGLKQPPQLCTEKVKQLEDFLARLISLMGFGGLFSFKKTQDMKIYLSLQTSSPSVLIGRQGRNLDALQVLANAYWMKLNEGSDNRSFMVILDIEDYRERHEEKLVSLALSCARKVRRTKGSLLLKPMNPFERRIIHTTINEMTDIRTNSEGTGNLKRVRIIYQD